MHASLDREPLEVELLAAPRAPPAGAVPGSFAREREEAVGGTIAGGWIGEADQLLAQHGVDRGPLFRRSHTRALQNVFVNRDGEIGHGISVTRDQCSVGVGYFRGAPAGRAAKSAAKSGQSSGGCR